MSKSISSPFKKPPTPKKSPSPSPPKNPSPSPPKIPTTPSKNLSPSPTPTKTPSPTPSNHSTIFPPSISPHRSVSVPRTRSRGELHVHSDSQVAYHVVPGGGADTDSAGSGGAGKVQKRVKLSRRKKASRSFQEDRREECFRRSSTPLRSMNVFHNKEIGVGTVTCPANSITAALLLAHQSLKLSCPLLPMELKPPVPAPLVVEDPPSSDNASDLEEDTVRYNLDPVFLNGSSGSFGSAGSSGGSTTTTGALGAAGGSSSSSGGGGGGKGARSAPSTPHGVVALGSAGVALAAGAAHEPHSQPTSPSPHQLSHLPRSPSHVFAKYDKYDKGTIKQLSSSAPVMTAQARSPEPPSPKGAKAEKMPAGSSKARQKKFHRHFTQVDDEERVLNYYSCALVGDILLQGHLYITKNYFAFYSNVFGYVTKLLIPISSVLKISKEKTARIIPNAVGVATADDKHVFGSLLSRDSTYKLMNMVLKAATNAAAEQTLPPPRDMRPGELDASEFSGDEDSSSQSGHEDTLRVPRVGVVVGPKLTPDICKTKIESGVLPVAAPVAASAKPPMPPLAKYNVFLLVSTLLLLLLFASAGVLLYRISRIQHRYMVGVPGAQDLAYTQPSSQDIYNEILHWQSQLHTKSAGAVHNFLDSNLDQIAKVRKSLEALSTLLMPNGPGSASEPRAEAPQDSGAPAPSPS